MLPLKGLVRNTSMAAGTFNLCKSAIGVGILSLPASMRNAGLMLGLLLLALGSFTTSSTLHFLARIGANTDLGDYYAVGRLAYGSWGEVVAVAVTLVYLFGALIGYASYTSTYFVEFFSFVFKVQRGEAWYVNSKVVIGISAMLIFPLACLRDLSKLARASVVGMACMAFVCGLTVVDYFVGTRPADATLTMFKFAPSALMAFSNILFAFCNHFTMVAIIPVFIDPTPRRRSILVTISATIVLLFYFLVSLFGYLHFGNSVADNILLSQSNMAYAIAQLLVACVIILSFPLLCDPTKSCVDFLISKMVGPPSRTTAHLRNLGITAALVASTAGLAMFAADALLPVLGVFTSLCGSMLMFVLPSMFFLRLGDRYSITKVERATALFDIGIGIIVLIFGTYFNAVDCIAYFTGSKS